MASFFGTQCICVFCCFHFCFPCGVVVNASEDDSGSTGDGDGVGVLIGMELEL